jgi:hypothetical protein
MAKAVASTKTGAKSPSKPPRELTADEVGFPEFAVGRVPEKFSVFDLSSHTRAREALEFALDINGHGFNTFVLGESRAGRLTETLTFLDAFVAKRPAPDDWVYLNNFRRPNEPKPYRLPPGHAVRLAKDMEKLIQKVRDALSKAFTSDDYKAQIKAHGEEINQQVNNLFQALRREAEAYGLNLISLPDGRLTVAPVKATQIGDLSGNVQATSGAMAASPAVDAAQTKIRQHLNDRPEAGRIRGLGLGTRPVHRRHRHCRADPGRLADLRWRRWHRRMVRGHARRYPRQPAFVPRRAGGRRNAHRRRVATL